MIAVELIGGLGNQMFQYAAGKALALNRKEDLVLDHRLFNSYKVHDYSLDHFNIHTPSLVNEIFFKPISFSDKVKAFIFHKKIFSKYVEKDLAYDQKLNSLSEKNVYLQGYFQSEKYFLNFEDQIRRDFEITSDLQDRTLKMLNNIESRNSVSLHIRRGDYISNPTANAVHGSCDLNYYYKAVAIIKSKIENPVFFIFSDDITWAKENLSFDAAIYFVDFTDASTNFEDIKMMSNCKHNIIANSSFSWWGAWLNKNVNKIVIAPEKWFNVDYHNTKDIIPESWLKI